MVWLKALTSLTLRADGLPGLSWHLAPSLLTALKPPARGGARSPVNGESKAVWHFSVEPWSQPQGQENADGVPEALFQYLLSKVSENIHCQVK